MVRGTVFFPSISSLILPAQLAQLAQALAPNHLLDKLWSQMSPLPPAPRYMPSFLSRMGPTFPLAVDLGRVLLTILPLSTTGQKNTQMLPGILVPVLWGLDPESIEPRPSCQQRRCFHLLGRLPMLALRAKIWRTAYSPRECTING